MVRRVFGWEVVVAGLLGPEFVAVCCTEVSSFSLTSRETAEPPWVDDRRCFLVQLSVEDGRVRLPGAMGGVLCTGLIIWVRGLGAGGCCSLGRDVI